jgi:alkylation response protein AidB-like acyl-CoA dehydrogenase
MVLELVETHGQPRLSFDGGASLDENVWKRFVELGLIALSVPEHLGGPGGSIMDQVIVAEQCGRATTAVPVVTSPVAGYVLAAQNTEPAKLAIASLLGGDEILLAAISASQGFDLGISAHEGTDGWRLSGAIHDLLEAASAHTLLVRAQTPNGATWFTVPVKGDGVDWREQPALDPTQRLGSITLESAAGVRVGSPTDDETLEKKALALALVLLAAQSTGVADRALKITVAYAKERRAFGQPIGRFQAIKHRLSEMLVLSENARAATYNAGWAFDADRDDTLLTAALAKAVATENAVQVVHGAIQAHGGIGFTWEHNLHLLLRRAKTCQLVLGSPDDHYEVIAATLLDPLLVAATHRED